MVWIYLPIGVVHKKLWSIFDQLLKIRGYFQWSGIFSNLMGWHYRHPKLSQFAYIMNGLIVYMWNLNESALVKFQIWNSNFVIWLVSRWSIFGKTLYTWLGEVSIIYGHQIFIEVFVRSLIFIWFQLGLSEIAHLSLVPIRLVTYI